VAGELNEPAAPRRVQFVAGLPVTVEDEIGKQALRPGTGIRDRSGTPGVWHAAG